MLKTFAAGKIICTKDYLNDPIFNICKLFNVYSHEVNDISILGSSSTVLIVLLGIYSFGAKLEAANHRINMLH